MTPPPPTPPPAAAPTDSSLLRRLRDGNESAAGQIYLRYARRLHNLARARCSPDLARREDADDIVQSVFTSFFRGVSRGYYDVPPGEELWKLLLVIALNKIRAKGNFHRAAKRDVRLTAGGEFLDAQDQPAGRDEAALGFLRLTVAEALEHLPEHHRQMVTLRVEGYEVAEIAAQTGRSKRTVERILQEARKKLALLLGED